MPQEFFQTAPGLFFYVYIYLPYRQMNGLETKNRFS